MRERDNFTLLLTARALMLQDAKEAHPRAVLSTNPSALRAANDCTTPVNGAAKTLTHTHRSYPLQEAASPGSVPHPSTYRLPLVLRMVLNQQHRLSSTDQDLWT
jgi:hypothetical protein